MRGFTTAEGWEGVTDTHSKTGQKERERELGERQGGRAEEGRGREIAGQTRFPLDGLAAENVPLLGK